ncbi:MAG: flagellar basal-body rod protein FlgF [Candidatus Sedimenticola sp. (ex Thyasira tokunagai)]
MLGSVYIGLSGLMTYSKGLDTISNNVANMNTPGYKRSDLLFRDLFYQQQHTASGDSGTSNQQIGSGVTGNSTTLSFSSGEIKETGNETDMAIDGNGFFILKQGTSTFYTRAGQFEFDQSGSLVASGTTAKVMGYSAGSLKEISISGARTNPAVATSEINFAKNLSTGSTTHELSTVAVIDSLGATHNLKITFTNNNTITPGSWLIDIEDSSGTSIATGGEIRFQGNGSPEIGFNSYSFTFSPNSVNPSTIQLNFGTAGAFTGTTSFSSGTTSDLAVGVTDGVAAGALLSVGFNRDGVLQTTYSNGVTADNSRLALAWFQDLQSLEQLGKSQFAVKDSQLPIISAANEGIMGSIVGKSIELSNVDLTLEFTDLIIMQRGFQGASQILTVSNEMMQQLLSMGKGGG